MLITLFKTFLLPPAFQLLLMLMAFFMWQRYRFLSRFMVFVAWGSLLALSMPVVSTSLYAWLEQPYLELYKAGIIATELDTEESQAEASDTIDLQKQESQPEQEVQAQWPAIGAIVVLGGGRIDSAPEYQGKDQVNRSSLWRLRYGAYLAREYQLPILVSGGTVYPYEKASEAALAEQVLKESFLLNDIWLEEGSRNTWENAQKTAKILEGKSIEHVYLVTHAYHMRRAVLAFEAADIKVTPMATGFVSTSHVDWWDAWLPKAYALLESRVALHEFIGLFFYQLKSFF